MSPVTLPLVALLSFGSVSAQSSSASVGGIVTDETGARLPGATVTITHVQNGRAETTTTGPEGQYRVVVLLPGDYDLAATHAGFQLRKQRVSLAVGADATVNLALFVARAITTDTSGETSLVESARAGPVSIVSRRDIETLPVLDRNFLMLAQLLPGSGPINGTVNRLATTKFGGPADQRVGYTTLIDGGDINDSAWGSPTINVGHEAVQEFTVFRHQFDAQYGHALTAVVSVATRSGTNRYSGSGFYFGRDDLLNARYHFASENLPFAEARVGGSLGGPIVRDRTHFFVSFEGDNVDTVRVVNLAPTNPFASRENGVFPAATNNRMSTGRLDHRFGPHALSVRYAGDRQRSLRAGTNVSSDSSQIDIANRSHSLVVEDTWVVRANVVHNIRLHGLRHTLGTTPRDAGTAERRTSVTRGLTTGDAWVVPATRLTLSNALYIHTSRADVKLGGELAFGHHEMDSHVFENGFFMFQTDADFSAAVSSTWPRSFMQWKPARSTYASQEIGAFVQTDWRVRDRLRLNAGLRYDVDLNLRLNDYYGKALNDPRFADLDHFISADRGTDSNNLQPRLGVTWDTRGDGTFLVRGAWGFYVTRNRPWFQLRSMNQFESSAVRVASPSQLKFYPDPVAVLGGLDLDTYLATFGGRQIGTLIPDDFVQPYAQNTTAGIAWQVNRATAITADYVHSAAEHQTGTTDVNLPPSGNLDSISNPRPVPSFSQVGMLENFSLSWYDALETQMRTQFGSRGSLQVSYTLSRSYLDGVDFFLTLRGTQRTPHEIGYNPSDQRHNFTLAGTVLLPWAVEVSGILKLVSGAPMKIQAGVDLDGDTYVDGDLPEDIPITVGRERVDESLFAINKWRFARGLRPIARSALDLDEYRTLDLRVTRSWRVGRSHRILTFLEGFNVTNRVNLRPPNPPAAGANMSSPAFLVRTAARDARQIQWGLRYQF
jgi:hypothetical protein